MDYVKALAEVGYIVCILAQLEVCALSARSVGDKKPFEHWK